MNNNSDTSAADSNQCYVTDGTIAQSYNLTLHIVSVFVLLVVSFLGAFFSIASARIKYLRVNPIIINTGKFFGSGVVLATGFIHILPDAMATLTDPCLPDSWNVYGAYAGLFAMLSALGMQLIEFLANQRFRSLDLKRHTHQVSSLSGETSLDKAQESKANDESIKQETNTKVVHEHTCVEDSHHTHRLPQEVYQVSEPTADVAVIVHGNHIHEKRKKSANHETDGNQTAEQNSDIEQDAEITRKHRHSETSMKTHNYSNMPETKIHKDIMVVDIPYLESSDVPAELCAASTHCHGAVFQDNDDQNKISTYLLEIGIALHSILIGVTLGTTSDSFVALFIALCFHQFFEAIALGAQIANVKSTSFKSAIYMIILFSLTTPVGIAIGIGVHAGIYNPKSVSTLLVTGILDSLSAGILIYVALVNLITAEMGINALKFYSLSGRLKLLYYSALYLGAAGMAIIGRWA